MSDPKGDAGTTDERLPCCQTKYGRHCGGECTCKICDPVSDVELPELFSNLKADIAQFQYSGVPDDLVNCLRGIYTILGKAVYGDKHDDKI